MNSHAWTAVFTPVGIADVLIEAGRIFVCPSCGAGARHVLPVRAGEAEGVGSSERCPPWPSCVDSCEFTCSVRGAGGEPF